jgi:hypothetical protein
MRILKRIVNGYGRVMNRNLDHIKKYMCLGAILGSYYGCKQFQKNIIKDSSVLDKSIYLSSSIVFYGIAGIPVGGFLGVTVPIWGPIFIGSYVYNRL